MAAPDRGNPSEGLDGNESDGDDDRSDGENGEYPDGDMPPEENPDDESDPGNGNGEYNVVGDMPDELDLSPLAPGDGFPGIPMGAPRTPDFEGWMGVAAAYVEHSPELYNFQIWRDFPLRDENGKEIKGFLERTSNAFDIEWLCHRHGGGKYNIVLCGPKNGRQNQRLKKIAGIRISGDPKPNPAKMNAEERQAVLASRRNIESSLIPQAQPAPVQPAPAPKQTVEEVLILNQLERERRQEEKLDKKEEQRRDGPAQQADIAGILGEMQRSNAQAQKNMMDLFRELTTKQPAQILPAPPASDAADRTLMMATELIKAFKPALAPQQAQQQAPQQQSNAPMMQAQLKQAEEEMGRLHKMVESLRDDVRQSQQLRDQELDRLRKQHAEELANLRSESRKAADDAYQAGSRRVDDVKAQNDTYVAQLKQQHDSYLATVKERYEDKVGALNDLLADFRSQLSDTRGKVSGAEQESQKFRFDALEARTEAKISAVQAASQVAAASAAAKPNEDSTGLAGLVKAVTQVRQVADVLNPPAPAAIAAVAPSVADRVAGIAEKAVTSPMMATIAEKILTRILSEEKPKVETKPPAPPANLAQAQQAWTDFQSMLQERGIQKRTLPAPQVSNALPAAPATGPGREIGYTDLDANVFESSMLAEGGLSATPEPPPPPPTPPPPEQPVVEVTEDQLSAVVQQLEEAAVTGVSPEQYLESIMAAIPADFLPMLKGIDPGAALGTVGLTRDRMTLTGAVYFDKVVELFKARLSAL